MRLTSLIAPSLVTAMACLCLAEDKTGGEPSSGTAAGKMVAKLKDGSEVVCRIEVAKVPLVTSFAKLDLPVSNIVSMAFGSESNEATIVLRNGDTLHGTLGIEKMTVSSLLGTLVLPLSKLASMTTPGLAPKRNAFMEVVPWESATNMVAVSDIVVLCLVDSFDAEAQSPMGRGDRTPAQMLQSYLAATRKMENEKSFRFDPNRITVYVVECGQATRNRARGLHEELGLFDYDNTIPVIFVFRKGKVKKVYTYYRSPGEGGRRLREYVETLSEPVEQ